MDKYKSKRENLKIIFYSLIQLVFLILLIYFSIIVFNSPDLNEPITAKLSIKTQEQRIVFLASLSTLFFITIFIGYIFLNNNIFGNKLFNIFFSLFSFLIGFYFLIKVVKERNFKNFIIDEYSKESSFKFFGFYKASNDKEKIMLTQNTIFVAFQFCVSLVGFSLCFVFEATNKNFPTDSLIMNNLTYFTEWGNIGSFIFMLSLVVTGHKFFFKNNSYILAMISYMSIIGIVFSLAFVFTIFLYHTPFNDPQNTAKSIWFHFINPISFVIFGAFLLRRSNQQMDKSSKYLIHALLLPAIYGGFVYSIPFFTNFTVYGFVTNLNENIVPYYGDDSPNFYNGGWQSVFFLLLIIIMFFSVITLSKFLLGRNLKKWKMIK
ncbi:MAG: DUF1600 domain-containing protein [Mycoplasmoidaceae bacterium]